MHLRSVADASGLAALVPLRCAAPVMTDRLVLSGDCAVCLGYGAIQGAVDAALQPLASTQPELFTLTDSLPAPTQQGCVLAIAWVACGLALNGYDVERLAASWTRRLAESWASMCVVVLGALWALSLAGLGPGLDVSEINFYTGSLSVLGAWRYVCAQRFT